MAVRKMKPLAGRIADLVEIGDRVGLVELFDEYHNADIALALRNLPIHMQETALTVLSAERAGRVLYGLNRIQARMIMRELDEKTLAQMMERLEPDQAADLVARMQDEQVEERVLRLMPLAKSKKLSELMGHDPESAGGLMTSDFISLEQSLTIQEAIETLRSRYSPDSPMHVYVTDENKILKGYLPLKRLITWPPTMKLKNVMVKTIATLTTRMDREEVAKIATKYDLFFLPVVEEDGRMVGVVSLDDVVDAIHEEASEDLLLNAGTDSVELTRPGVLVTTKARLPWLFASWVGGVIALAAMRNYEHILASVVSLAAFIPLVMGLGGNAGNQTATVLVRALALGQATLKDTWWVIFKEIRVGLMLGTLFGTMLGVVAKMFYSEGPHLQLLGLVVGLSILAAICIGVLVGSIFPLLFKRLNIDPAIATAPFVASSLDLLGILVYFTLARTILGL